MNKYDILEKISLGGQDEYQALSIYYDLWSFINNFEAKSLLSSEIYDELVSIIKIAISEELKHAQLLNNIAEKISGIKAEGE